MKLYEILYVSALAPATSVMAMPDILGKARRYNKANDITGLLIFDGARFAHLIEGARDAVFELVERIRLDARHINMEVLHYADTAERRFNRFTVGYVPVEHEHAIEELAALDGEAAIVQFLAMVPVLDLDR